jgi:hypothetical protein
MVRETSYQATFDGLAIVGHLEKPLRGVTNSEVHLLAYLACLLAVSRGRPVSDWNYRFVRSSWGAPYSPDIEAALEEARTGALLEGEEMSRLTGEGREFLDFLYGRSQHAWRSPYLAGATGSALAIPPGIIRDALRQEPGLRATELHLGAQPLLDKGSLTMLHEHFRALSEAIGPNLTDLMIPSVIWIRYLAEIRRQETATLLEPAAETNEPVAGGWGQ